MSRNLDGLWCGRPNGGRRWLLRHLDWRVRLPNRARTSRLRFDGSRGRPQVVGPGRLVGMRGRRWPLGMRRGWDGGWRRRLPGRRVRWAWRCRRRRCCQFGRGGPCCRGHGRGAPGRGQSRRLRCGRLGRRGSGGRGDRWLGRRDRGGWGHCGRLGRCGSGDRGDRWLGRGDRGGWGWCWLGRRDRGSQGRHWLGWCGGGWVWCWLGRRSSGDWLHRRLGRRGSGDREYRWLGLRNRGGRGRRLPGQGWHGGWRPGCRQCRRLGRSGWSGRTPRGRPGGHRLRHSRCRRESWDPALGQLGREGIRGCLGRRTGRGR